MVRADEQFCDVVAVMAVTVRILDWAIRDLDRLRLPDQLFEPDAVRPTGIAPGRIPKSA